MLIRRDTHRPLFPYHAGFRLPRHLELEADLRAQGSVDIHITVWIERGGHWGRERSHYDWCMYMRLIVMSSLILSSRK